MTTIKQCFSDSKGQVSSLRIIQFIVFFAFTLTYSYLSISQGKFIPIPNDILTVLITLTGAKLYQKQIEEKDKREKDGNT